MHYYSTNRNSDDVSFRKATVNGIAEDGGVYVPADIPVVPEAFFRNMPAMGLKDIAYVVMNTLIGDEINSGYIKEIISEALNYDIPVLRLGNSDIFSAELFHGSTGSSKDLGARFMARIFQQFFSDNTDSEVIVLASVTSESGVAIADALCGVEPFRVLVVFPKGKLSSASKEKIFSLEHNIRPVEVRGSVDDCLAMIQAAMSDSQLRENVRLTSANSINIARLLPTVIQYFWIWSQMVSAGVDPNQIVISVPCANLGSFAAALIAVKMGLPLKRIIAASTVNNAFVEYLQTGRYNPADHKDTLAPCLDIMQPLNFPRVIDLLKGLGTEVVGCAVSDNEIVHTAASLSESYGYSADPHTCVSAAALIKKLSDGESGAFLATLSPDELLCHNTSQQIRHESISPTYQALKRIIDPIHTY